MAPPQYLLRPFSVQYTFGLNYYNIILAHKTRRYHAKYFSLFFFLFNTKISNIICLLRKWPQNRAHVEILFTYSKFTFIQSLLIYKNVLRQYVPRKLNEAWYKSRGRCQPSNNSHLQFAAHPCLSLFAFHSWINPHIIHVCKDSRQSKHCENTCYVLVLGLIIANR